ncbi:MAG TPA: O-antigen ligase family protein [Candidatus Methanoperedens sp.]|nr:O-antigen ligase family protein [Candidatus Methanoperedens sp.]
MLAGLLVLPHLALGAVAPWARLSVFLSAAVLFTLWTLKVARTGNLVLRRDPVWYVLLAFWALLLLQVLPLPGFVASQLSGVARLERLNHVSLGAGGHDTLSLSPHDTWMSLARLAALTLLFFVTANTVRRRGQVLLLLIALIAAGTLETLYGFSAYYAGQRYPPWSAVTGSLSGVLGTFPHKNYFSGFLEMIVPVAIGLLVYLGRKRSDGGEPGADRAPAQWLRSPGPRQVFFQQVMLASAAVVLISGIAFSLCRAGVFILLATLAVFMVLLGLSRPSRPYILAVLLLGGLAALAGAAIGLDKVILAVEDAGSRESSSWLHRWDIARNALGIVRDFPLFGTGLGTSGQTFTRYQSSQHADLRVSYLHNDVLQLLCETGIVAWAIFVGGMAWFLARIARDLRRRRDPFSTWVGTGALLGVGAMLLHSLFEHNLGKVTSNAVVFTVLLAIAWACSRGMGDRRRLDQSGLLALPLGSPRRRAAFAAGGVAVSLLAFSAVLPLIRAELALNRHLAESGKPDPHFFLPVTGQEGDPAAGPRAAVALAPSSHRYHHAAALQALTAAEETVRKGAIALLGLGESSGDDKDVDQVVLVLLKNLPPGLAAARAAETTAARRHLDAAVRLAPAMADYHFLRGATLFELEGATPEVLREAEAAARLAPRVPRILFGVANLLFGAGLEKSEPERGLLWGKARELLREALLVDPSYATRVYPLVRTAFGLKGLIEVTPPTIRASEVLYQALWQESRWEEALALLGEMERMALEKFGAAGEEVVDPDEEAFPRLSLEDEDTAGIGRSFDRRTEAELRRSLAQRRALLLGMLGRWEERQAAIARHRGMLREDSARRLQGAVALRQQGRTGEALRQCQAILEQDWPFAAALLEAAELATLPDARTDGPPWSEPLDYLYRLVLYGEDLGAAELRRLTAALDGYNARSGPDQARVDFLRGAAHVLGGRPEEGLRTLRQLIGEVRPADTPWGQTHLPWYYMGRGQEELGRVEDAVRSYRTAVDLVPGHLPSLRRLAALRKDGVARLARIEPGVKLNASFGGRLALLGYTLARPASRPPRDEASLTLHWQLTERLEARYRPMVRLGEPSGAPVFGNGNAITKDGLPYPLEAPRSGEVVTETYSFPASLLSGHLLKVALMVPGTAQSLSHDVGGGFLLVALE